MTRILALNLVLASLAVFAGCGAPETPQDSGAGIADAAVPDAAPASAVENIAGVWLQRLQSYPDLLVVWAISPDGWGNIDARGSSGAWCRSHVTWEVLGEVSTTSFTFSYTFVVAPCSGTAIVGDTLQFTVIEATAEDPLTLLTDWGGGAIMELCERDLAVDEPCQVGDDQGPFSELP